MLVNQYDDFDISNIEKIKLKFSHEKSDINKINYSPHSLSVWKNKVDQEIELNQNNVQKSNNIANQIIISFNKSSKKF